MLSSSVAQISYAQRFSLYLLFSVSLRAVDQGTFHIVIGIFIIIILYWSYWCTFSIQQKRLYVCV